MRVLFIHQAFPAQFGRLALELVERYGWSCHFLIESLSNCPAPSKAMLETLDLRRLPVPAEPRPSSPTPWPQIYGRFLDLCQVVHDAARPLEDLQPDLVVAHGGRGAPTLFLPDIFDCPILNYCEYYFARARRDISYRIDLPPAEPAHFFPRSINAPTLASLISCHGGYSATRWQKESFPERFWPKIEVHFDGIDIEQYKPGPRPSPAEVSALLGGRSLGPDTKIVTYVARGLESMRGFDVFMKVAKRIARERPDVLFVVAGQEEIYYGWDKLHTGQPSFKQWVLSRDTYDLSRFVFLGHIHPDRLADLLRLSDLHLYMTVPFVLSWSFINALASGPVVIGSDVPPVREVITPGVHGLVEPLFDVDRWAESSLRVLADPAAYRPLTLAARGLIEERYSLDVSIPDLKDYFERMASGLPPTPALPHKGGG
ncbi:MAG TPA: glycosyltransferase [Isosphaeraceae bacterium]|nr:glycosyltransferase [Isosphaeraceae bacterium]